MTQPEIIKIPRSKISLFLMLLGSVIFVVIGIFMQHEQVSSDRSAQELLVLQGIGFFGMMFFGLCGLVALARLFSNKPGLIITDEGINYNANVILWSEITEFGEYEKKGTKCILIHINDPKSYIDKGNFLQRSISGVNYKMTGTPLSISSTDLKIEYDDLKVMLNEYLSQSRLKSAA
ncbi:STM3941 family protein [Kiloniella antarctica]|uniref:STM3941 family protein n=1 Tax=Kiloniella antarctica TaxID=1550907 RepID=A0ABW5BKX4_9PROT